RGVRIYLVVSKIYLCSSVPKLRYLWFQVLKGGWRNLRDFRRRRRRFEQRELAASGHHVLPTRIANENPHALVSKDSPELFHARRVRLFVWQLARIPRNQVHFGAQVRHQPDHPPRVVRGIVESAEQDVFEREVFPRPQGIPAGSVEQLRNRILAIDGHDLVALLIGRCIQGNRDLWPHFFLREALNARNDAARRKRHVLGRDGHAVWVEQNPHRRHDGVVVQQGLALPHQDHVGLGLQGFAILFQRDEHLSENFTRRQIPHKTQRRRQTEMAIHRASCLRGNANRLAILLRHENGLDGCALCASGSFGVGAIAREAEHIADRSITRAITPHHSRQRNRRFACQALAQRCRKIRHRREIEAVFGIKRVVNLRAAVSGFPERLRERTQLLRALAEQVAIVAKGSHKNSCFDDNTLDSGDFPRSAAIKEEL